MVTDTAVRQVPDFDGTQTGGAVTLSIQQAASEMGVNERTARRRAKSGKLPEGWSVVPDRAPTRILVLDSRTLKDKTGDTTGASQSVSDALAAENAALRSELAGAQGHLAESRSLVSWLQDRLEAAEGAAKAEREQAAADRQEAAAERERLLALIPRQLPGPRQSWWARTFRGNREATDA